MSRSPDVAIIGGTGVYDVPGLRLGDAHVHDTAYGQALLRFGRFADDSGSSAEVVFLARHGTEHTIPPHRVNYRANIAALQDLGVGAVVATAAVGSLRRDLPPGRLVLLDQFLDFTRCRPSTFFDGDGRVEHTDMTQPYDATVRKLLIQAAQRAGIELESRGTYVCTEGPRFETTAEVAMFAGLGGDVVGMTNVPEVVLAREAGLSYAAVALVTNLGAGLSPSPLTHEEVVEAMEENAKQLADLRAALFCGFARAHKE